MKNLFSFIIIISLFLCCKKNKEDTILISKIEATNKVENTNKADSIQICIENKQSFDSLKGLTTNGKINIEDKLGSKLYYAISKKDFNNLFNGEDIKCITPARSEKYLYFNIYYTENKDSKDVYLKIKNLKTNNENLNKYHDFFKRGLVFILDTKENKITLITFNIFADNSLVKKTINFFKSNKNSFEEVIMYTGISTVQDLSE